MSFTLAPLTPEQQLTRLAEDAIQVMFEGNPYGDGTSAVVDVETELDITGIEPDALPEYLEISLSTGPDEDHDENIECSLYFKDCYSILATRRSWALYEVEAA